MAMRFRRTSSMASLQQAPYYEDFEPISEWKEETAQHVLTIYLPGFSKEQMRVSVAENLRGIRVRGERPLGGNRFRRFALEFDLPDNSKLNEMIGKFEDDKLLITIPKETVHYEPPPPSKVVETTPPSPPAYAKEDTIRKPSIFEPVTDQKSPEYPKTPYDHTAAFEKKMDETRYEDKQRDLDNKRALDHHEKQQETTPYYAPKTTSAREQERLTDEEKAKADRERKQLQQQQEKIKEPERVAPPKISDREMMKTSAEYAYDTYGDTYYKKSGVGAVPPKKASMDEKRKEIFNMVNETKNQLQRMARELDEETQLTVNLALAVLEVAGAVGAYISYRSSSSNTRPNM